MANGDGITYTAKELLQKLDEKTDRIEDKLDRKADASAVDEIRVRLERAADRAEVEVLAQRLLDLENQVKTQDKVNEALRSQAKETRETSVANLTRREKIAAGLIGLCSVVVQVLNALGVFHR